MQYLIHTALHSRGEGWRGERGRGRGRNSAGVLRGQLHIFSRLLFREKLHKHVPEVEKWSKVSRIENRSTGMQEWECHLASKKSVSYTHCSSELRSRTCVSMILSGSLVVAEVSCFVLRSTSTAIMVRSLCMPMTAMKSKRGEGGEGEVRGRKKRGKGGRGKKRRNGVKKRTLPPFPVHLHFLSIDCLHSLMS